MPKNGDGFFNKWNGTQKCPSASAKDKFSNQRYHQVAEMLLAGKRHVEIAMTLGISVPAVHRYERVLRARWLANADAAYDSKLSEELEHLRQIRNDACDAWEESKKPAQVIKRVSEVQAAEGTAPPPSGDLFEEVPADADPLSAPEPVAQAPLVVVHETVELRGQVGDPRFLDIREKCTVDRLKLMGAFKDENVYASFITRDQMMAFAQAFLAAAARVIHDQAQLAQLRAETVKLLPSSQPGHATMDVQGETEA